jgi:hypothetical protein
MIATKNTKTAAAPAKRTPYCDTCYRKGLSEKEYTSHYTKSEPGPRGVVVCPTILNTVCRACGLKGHWASEKFCSVVRREAKEDRRYKERQERQERKEREEKMPAKNQSRFAVLQDDEEEEVAVAPVAVASGPSWADMAKKPAVLVPKAEEPSPLTTLKFHTVYYDPKDTKYEPLMTDAEREAYRILEERKAAGCFEKRRSWLDLSDDEEEEEEDENW